MAHLVRLQHHLQAPGRVVVRQWLLQIRRGHLHGVKPHRQEVSFAIDMHAFSGV